MNQADWFKPPQKAADDFVTSLGPTARVLLAVSGGADSMGLLGLLTGFEKLRGRLYVLHVNHGLRASAMGDEQLVVDFCRCRGLPISVEHVNTLGHAHRLGMSIEHSGRILRYEALGKAVDTSGCQWIVTGHTADDSAETVLMRIRSGAPWYEWTGIPERRGRIVRPLLKARRTDLREWTLMNGIPFADDETNLDPRFRRNALRLDLVASPSTWQSEHVFNYCVLGKSLSEYLEHARGVALADCASGDPIDPDCISLDITRILTYFKSLEFLPIEAAWSKMQGVNDKRLPSHIRSSVAQLLQATTPQSSLGLPGGIRLIKRGRRVWVYRNTFSLPAQPANSPGLKKLDGVVECEITRDVIVNGDNLISQPVSRELLGRSLTLRLWQAGDRLKLSKRPRKKLSDLMCELKMNPRERERAWVLADDNGPLVLLGKWMDERALPQIDEGLPAWLNYRLL